MKYSVEHALSTIRNMWPLLLATILHVQMFEFLPAVPLLPLWLGRFALTLPSRA